MTRHQLQIQAPHPFGIQPLPAGAHLLPSELARSVLVQGLAGYQCVLACHRAGPIKIEQVDPVAADQVYQGADHRDHVEPGPSARTDRDIEITCIGLTARRAAEHHDEREAVQVGQGLEAAVDRSATEPVRRIDRTDRHVAEHSWRPSAAEPTSCCRGVPPSSMQPAQRGAQIGDHVQAHLGRCAAQGFVQAAFRAVYRGHQRVPETQPGGLGQAPA